MEGFRPRPAARRRGRRVGRLREAPAARARAGPRAAPAGPDQGQHALDGPSPGYLDYIGVKRFDAAGAVTGERRFLGLYTTAAYRRGAAAHPVAARQGRRRSSTAPASRPTATTTRRWSRSIETYPRDELFQISADELFEIAIGILELGERQRVRLFVRRDRHERFVSCLVFLPRDRFNTDNRERIGEILRDALGAERVDWALRLTESVLVRIHYIAARADRRAARLRRRGDRGADRRGDAQLGRRPRGRAGRGARRGAGHRAVPPLRRRLSGRLPRRLARPFGGRRHAAARGAAGRRGARLSLYRPLEAPAGALRCKLFQRGERVSLSDVLPMFENMGLRGHRRASVRDHAAPTGAPAWIYDFGLQAPARRRRRRDPRRASTTAS